MALVKVWNDHVAVDPKEHRDPENQLDKGFDGTWREIFQDEEIIIPPGGYIEMDWEKAIMFEGQYFPIATDGNNNQLLRSKKKIRVDGRPSATGKDTTQRVFVCQADGSEHPSKAALEAYVKENFSHLMVDEDAKKELTSGKRKAS